MVGRRISRRPLRPSLGQRRVEEGGSAGHLQFAPALRVVWAFWTMTGDLKGPLS